MTNNVAYLRISHTESLNGTSLDVQESKCKAYAELHGLICSVFNKSSYYRPCKNIHLQ